MTKYLSGQPFTEPVGAKVSQLQWDIAFGKAKWCKECVAYVYQPHTCPDPPLFGDPD
jgi:hypothetical protein